MKNILYGIGLFLVVAGLTGIGLYVHDKQIAIKPVKIVSAKTVVLPTNTPSEAPVSASDFANTSADQPRQIVIPTINVSGYIQKVGIDKNNQIAVPNNIHLAGWYINSSKPGSPGLSIIDGHVLGRYNDAIFKDLSKLKLGDTFSVIYGDNSKKMFTVKDILSMSVNDATTYLNNKDPNIKNQLDLITCGGIFDKKSQTYDKRVVVKSEGI